MTKYELAVVLDGETSTAKKKTVAELIEKVVKTVSGKVGKVEEWKKQHLAYKMGKSETGIYLFFPLELDASKVGGLDSKLRLEKDILRYMLIKQEESVTEAKPKKTNSKKK